jgi:two-component system cell cycle sensor histidine kinase/response regulator CckA
MALAKRPLQVLVIDDYKPDRTRVLRMVRHGFPKAIIHEVADESALVGAMAQASFDAVVMEYRLGWSDGLTLLKTIKTHIPQAAVIWMSRGQLDETIASGMRAGLSDYLPKTHLHRLVDVIKDSLERQACDRGQLEALQELCISEQRHRTIAGLTSDYAYALRVDALGVITADWVSERFTAVTGYTLEALAAQGGWMSLIHPEDVPLAAQRRECWRAGEANVSEFRILTRRGEERWVRDYTSPTPVKDSPGIMQIHGAVQDVTRYRLLEEPLRQAQKMEALGRLAGRVAHDFNNVLQVISGYSDIVLKRMTRRSRLRQYLQEIRNGAEHGVILTRQLMMLSRKPILQPEVIEIRAVLDKLIPALQHLLGDGVELHTTAAPGLGQAYIDPTQLEQVILNLAVNARDAMPEGGRLTVEVATIDWQSPISATQARGLPGHHLKLTVRDTSGGMDAEALSHVFEPFFGVKEQGKGGDLSLYTAYSIVNHNGGHIQVESTPGVGTTFTIYWPYMPPLAMPAGTVSAVPAVSTASGETILLVEDEAIVRDLVRRVLQASGYTVLEATNGDEAIRLAHEHHGLIHLLLADVVLPGLSGPEIADRLANTRPRLPILFMSGYAQDSVERYGLSLTSHTFLQKPFTPLSLLNRVRDALEASRAEPP